MVPKKTTSIKMAARTRALIVRLAEVLETGSGEVVARAIEDLAGKYNVQIEGQKEIAADGHGGLEED